MAEDLEHFIKTMALGIPTIKPDEKRAFLGNFRERVAMAITIKQLRDARITTMLDAVLTRYPGYRIFLNGRMGDEGVTRFAPGSEQWVAALDATDDDAMRLDRLIRTPRLSWTRRLRAACVTRTTTATHTPTSRLGRASELLVGSPFRGGAN